MARLIHRKLFPVSFETIFPIRVAASFWAFDYALLGSVKLFRFFPLAPFSGSGDPSLSGTANPRTIDVLPLRFLQVVIPARRQGPPGELD